MTYKEKLDKFTFLVPIFNLEGDRLENFKFVLSKLVETEANILVVEQVKDKRKKTIPKELCKKVNVEYLPVKVDDTHIHKSKLINIGTDHIKTEFVWVNDSDCYIKFREAINLIDFRYNFIQPYKVGKYLEEQESNKIRNNEKVNIDFSYTKDKGHHIFTGTYSYVGMFGALSFIYKKEDFYSIGKMNENYRGWGLEDNSLCRRMFEYSKLRLNILNIYAIHLYHPRNIFADKLRDYNGDTAKNIKVYEKEFNNKYTIINKELRDYYTKFFEEDKKISIIGLSRSGTTYILTGIASANNLICYPEFLNEYGLLRDSLSVEYNKTDRKIKIKDQPYIECLNDNIDLERYIELIYQNNNICTKHLFDEHTGTRVFKKDVEEFHNTCSLKILQLTNKTIITTRFNFLDWLTSRMLASSQLKWNYFQGEYTAGITKISKEQFNDLYKIWHKYHFDTLPKLKKICDSNNINYEIIDYEDISNETTLNNRLHKLGINNFIPTLKKQKNKPNQKYITNYDQVREWYAEKKSIPFYILTRFSLKWRNKNNHLNKKWLENRLKIFETCFESINNQTFKQYKWLLLIHPDTLDFAKNKLHGYKNKLPQIEIIELDSNIRGESNKHICKYIKNQIKHTEEEGEFITMWHDSDDILIDKNAILDFYNRLEFEPVNTLARSSVQSKGTDCNISPQLDLQYDTQGTFSTCIAAKSGIKKLNMFTILKHHHEKWGLGHEPNINIIDVLPKKPRHYKIIHRDAVFNTPVNIFSDRMIIFGTGRCGSSCLLKFFDNAGASTQARKRNVFNENCLGGYESSVQGFKEFKIIKNTWDKDIFKKIKRDNIDLKHVIIPIRNLDDASESRRYQTKTYGNGTDIIPGGIHLDATMEPGSMESKLLEFIYNGLLQLSELNIQPILLNFPRFVEDKKYLWDKIHHLLTDIKYDEFVKIFDETFDKTKVHTYTELTNNLISLYNKLPKSDKGTVHCYIQKYYSDIFKNKNINKLVEIGVKEGYSINLWSRYFGNKTNVYGIDINLKKIDPSIVFNNNVNLIEKNAVNKDIKSDLPDDIDIIIDDGSHKLEHQIDTFRLLFPKLKEGGIYIIEDIKNIDTVKDSFLDLPGQVKIHDLRHVKNRYDDVIVEITKVPAFNIIDEHFNIHCNRNCSIHEHLPVIAKYSSECDTIVEMGVRNIVSTWALLKGRPKKLTSIDIKSPPEHRLDLVNQACKSENINFSFIKNNTLDVEIDECDLLFIDTFHTYKHLKQELKLHGNKSKKYLIFHDTVTFGRRGQDSSTPGLLAAIDEFIEENPHWIKKKFYNNNHGLGILERVR